MASFAREKALVQLLLDRLGLHGSLSDPNAGVPETGIDVLVHTADGRVIGVQVTEADPHPEAGKARGQGKWAAGTDTNKVYGGWAQNDRQAVLDSLFRSISGKGAKAERYSFASVSEVWLLVCAGIPEHGAAIPTFVVTPWFSASDMNRATHRVLQQSKYDRCFLLAILSTEQALYKWERSCGWEKSVKPDDPSEIPSEGYEASLLRARFAGDCQEFERLSDEEANKARRKRSDNRG